MSDSLIQKWTQLSDEELLQFKICDLKINIEDSPYKPQMDQLFEELKAKGLENLKPKIYFGDEWFSPEGVCAIAVPFYLAHTRLRLLEEKMMLEAEGASPSEFMKLIRHEAGHCFDHVFRFSKRPKWKSLFGSPELEYDPDTYHPKPYSRSFVKHLDRWYAQSHPDEDFAETFAVWLNPDSNWKTQYKKWPGALKKLEYLDRLAREATKKNIYLKKPHLISAAARSQKTLNAYYIKKKKERDTDYPDFYDSDLKKIFSGGSELSKRDYGAHRFMKKNKKIIVNSISRWTGERKYTISLFIKKLINRCESLDLRLGSSESETFLQLSAYLATLITNYLFTGKFKRNI